MTTLVKKNGSGRTSLFPELSGLFDDFLTRDLMNFGPKSGIMPAVNIKESDTAYDLEFAVPGMEKKDFNIELKNNMLIVSAEKENKQEEKSEDGDYVRKEFGYQSFTRSFSLPETSVKGDEIKASYKDGILCVNIPKREKEKQSSKSINVE